MDKIIGIDLGGTKYAVVLGRQTPDGGIEICRRACFPTETAKGVDYALQNIYLGIDKLLAAEKIKATDLSTIGISCGGPLNSERGIIMSPPNLPGWDNIPITDLLEKRYGVKTRLQNDANACALAEWKYGAGRGYKNMIFLTFGTGMGAGLILDGRLYVGTNDMAGEVGHIRLKGFGPVGYGKAGSFEGFCSGGGIAQLARIKALEQIQLGNPPPFCKTPEMLPSLTAKTIAKAALAKDPLAIDIYRTCGLYLGKALSILIDILNPEIIVLGSIYERAKGLIEPSMRSVIEQESLSYSRSVCRIVPAELEENIGDMAALAVASYLL